MRLLWVVLASSLLLGSIVEVASAHPGYYDREKIEDPATGAHSPTLDVSQAIRLDGPVLVAIYASGTNKVSLNSDLDFTESDFIALVKEVIATWMMTGMNLQVRVISAEIGVEPPKDWYKNNVVDVKFHQVVNSKFALSQSIRQAFGEIFLAFSETTHRLSDKESFLGEFSICGNNCGYLGIS